MSDHDAIERARERSEGFAYEEYHDRAEALVDDDDGLSDPDVYLEHVIKPRQEREGKK